MAARIVATQPPPRIASAFLRAFRSTYGPVRDRAIDALRELGPEFIQAFLERDHDEYPALASLPDSISLTSRSS